MKHLTDRWEALKLALRWTWQSSPGLTFLIAGIVILGGLLTIVDPYLFKVILDGLLAGGTYTLSGQLTLGLLAILAVYAVTRILQSLLWDVQSVVRRVHSHKLDKHASVQLMTKVSSLDSVYFEDPKYYNTLTKANQNFAKINDFFWQFTFFLGELVSVLVIVGALFSFDWRVVALIIFAAAPSIIFAFRASEVEWSAFDGSLHIGRQAMYYKSLMTEKPEAIKELKLFNLKGHFIKKFEVLLDQFISAQKKAACNETYIYAIISIIEGVFSIFAAWLVINAFVAGTITIGELTFLWALLFQFADHARHMVRSIGDVSKAAAYITPFVTILGLKPVIIESPRPVAFPKKLKHGIEFRNVTFSYPRAKKPILKDFNLVIRPGESIALVGENGSGKTTLVKLLTRMYDVTEGEILIDGVDIREYSLESLHENMGVIFQDFVKYEALVEENIGFGNVKRMRGKEGIHRASVRSEAWRFIRKLDDAYKTPLGKTLHENGTELSGGQWQKIALARAFFKDAQVLCLDEPTAAVDAKAEYRLFRKFEKLTHGKITLLISHRFSTVRMVDMIVVMAKGTIVESGNHEELIRKHGLYASLFKMQAEGFKDFFRKKKR